MIDIEELIDKPMNNEIVFPDVNKQALEIVKYYLKNPDVTISEKTEAIKHVAEMRIHDDLGKADLISALRWLFKHYDFEE